VSAIRTALKFRRGVNVSFGGKDGLSLPAHVQSTKLSRLVQILDHKLPDLDLHGLNIIIGSDNGSYGSIDNQGNIWLGIINGTNINNEEEEEEEEEEERWTLFLEKGVDLQLCRQRKALLVTLHQQAMLTASGLGIAFIGTHPHLALTNEYLSFLEAAAALCSNNNNNNSGGPLLQGLSKVVVVVVSSLPPPPPPPPTPTTTTNANSKSTIDEATGALHVPVSLQGEPFIDVLKTLGPRSSYLITNKEQLEAELSVLKKQVERRLRLRKLLRYDDHHQSIDYSGDHVSPEQYKACCERLIGCGDQLQRMMEGMSIRIGRVNGVSVDGSVISIAWNWTL
jgi:hypothetical protein